jgi:phage shock protein A
MRGDATQKQWQQAEKDVARLSGQVSALETSLAKAGTLRKTKSASRTARSSKVVRRRFPAPHSMPLQFRIMYIM